MDDIEFKEFWDWMLEKSGESEHWWLDDWLNDNLNRWRESQYCPKCKSRLVAHGIHDDVWSKTGNYVLEIHHVCKKCGHTIEIIDKRKEILQALENGNVKLKDVNMLKQELSSHEPRDESRGMSDDEKEAVS